MYKDTGKKILGLANTICIIGIVISCIGGLVVMASDEDMIIVGLLAAALGSLGSWLGSLLLAGFGELIANTAEIRNMLAASQILTATTPLPTPLLTVRRTASFDPLSGTREQRKLLSFLRKASIS